MYFAPCKSLNTEQFTPEINHGVSNRLLKFLKQNRNETFFPFFSFFKLSFLLQSNHKSVLSYKGGTWFVKNIPEKSLNKLWGKARLRQIAHLYSGRTDCAQAHGTVAAAEITTEMWGISQWSQCLKKLWKTRGLPKFLLYFFWWVNCAEPRGQSWLREQPRTINTELCTSNQTD